MVLPYSWQAYLPDGYKEADCCETCEFSINHNTRYRCCNKHKFLPECTAICNDFKRKD